MEFGVFFLKFDEKTTFQENGRDTFKPKTNEIHRRGKKLRN